MVKRLQVLLESGYTLPQAANLLAHTPITRETVGTQYTHTTTTTASRAR